MQFSNPIVPDKSITPAKFASDRFTVFKADGSFTVPYTGQYVITGCGGGGGGGGGGCCISTYLSYGNGGNGGLSGFQDTVALTLVAGTVIPVTIGTGGLGGTVPADSNGSIGGDGTATLFGSYAFFSGGLGGHGGEIMFTSYTNTGLHGGNGNGNGAGRGGARTLNANGGPGGTAEGNSGAGGGGGGGTGSDMVSYLGGVGGDGAAGFIVIQW